MELSLSDTDGEPGPWPLVRGDDHGDYRTGRERILDALRDRILSGVLPPGTRLNLDTLAAEFGTSRTPVREACLTLSHDGLVRIAQRSGISVIGLTPEAILENFALMAALSGVAAQWAARGMTRRELLRVRELNREIKVAAAEGNDIATLNWLFHREINKACHSPRLQSMLADAGRMIPKRFFELFPEHVPCSLGEHDALVAALERGDETAARKLAEDHFASAARVLRAQFHEQGGETEA